MTTLLEADDLGPVSLHAGRAFVMEADPSVSKKSDFDELFSPTPRFRLVSIELARPARAVVCEQHVPRPIGLRIDDEGGVLVGPQSALLDGSLRTVRRLEGCAAHPDKGCSLGRRYAVFGCEKDSKDEVRRIDRKTGEVTTIARAQEGGICTVGGDDEVFGWYEEHGAVLRWAAHTDPEKVNELAVPDEVKEIHRVDGRWLLRTRRALLVVDGGDTQQLSVKAQKLAVGARPWFAVLGGYSSFDGSKEEVVGAAIARLGDLGEAAPIFACAPAEGSDLLGGPDVSELASDGRHVVFVERMRQGCRLHCLPVDAPAVDRLAS